MRRFTLHWGQVAVFAQEPVPELLLKTKTIVARLDYRFRPAVLRLGIGAGGPLPFTAVWPEGNTVPPLVGNASLTDHDMAGVVLAEVVTHTCFVCSKRFHVIRDAPLPFFGNHLRDHRIVSGCPACGSDFGRSRIDGLAVLPTQ